MKKLNCWEFMKCGRDPQGAQAAQWGVCPASTHSSTDGFNSGKNGGRICWSVAGTLCSTIQGKFAKTVTSCLECEFYIRVMKEELSADVR